MGIEAGWGGVVRLTLPDGWTAGTEEHEGRPTAVFRPPAGPGALRLVTESLAPGGGVGAAEVTLREMALRFLRPDDARVADRVLEDRPGGGIIATAALRAGEGQETHYLWMIGAADGAGVRAAMFGCALAAAEDGTDAAAAVLGAVDDAIRGAVLLDQQ